MKVSHSVQIHIYEKGIFLPRFVKTEKYLSADKLSGFFLCHGESLSVLQNLPVFKNLEGIFSSYICI